MEKGRKGRAYLSLVLPVVRNASFESGIVGHLLTVAKAIGVATSYTLAIATVVATAQTKKKPSFVTSKIFVENIFIGLMKRFGRRLLSMVVGICPLGREDLMTVSWCLSRLTRRMAAPTEAKAKPPSIAAGLFV